MAISHTRACSACHAAKVKCVKVEGSSKCKRCERLGLKCVEHVSRQGQGTRRRKKVKTTVTRDENAVDQALAITKALNQDRDGNSPIPFVSKSQNGDSSRPLSSVVQDTMICHPICIENRVERKNGQTDLCTGIDSMTLEDNFIRKSISNNMGRDHFGLNFLIREWIALAFSRRSFSLLARASFIAVKMNIPMDDIISNQSPFAIATESEPMEFLARDILLPKSERKTLGYPMDLEEMPWDLLEAVQIDPAQPAQGVRNRWIGVRWSCQGVVRFWVSRNFSRDFASLSEISEVWEENSPNKEVIDLFLPISEKGKFGSEIFNLLFVNYKPGMGCFVVKNPYKVKQRNVPEPVDVDVIQTMKLVDLDSMFHYFEIQFRDRNIEDDAPENVQKRQHAETYTDNINDDPIMGDGIEFTDIEVTSEMEEFLKLLNGNEDDFSS